MKWLYGLKTIKILGKTYEICYSPIDEELSADTKLGKCDWTTGKIYAQTELKDDVLFDVVLHEIIHALNFDMEIGLEEKQINTIASGLQAVIMDNFELLPRQGRNK